MTDAIDTLQDRVHTVRGLIDAIDLIAYGMLDGPDTIESRALHTSITAAQRAATELWELAMDEISADWKE